MKSLRLYKIDTQSPIHSDICLKKNQIIRKNKKVSNQIIRMV